MFDLTTYLAGIDERLLEVSEGRRILTRLSPMLFGLLYFPHHLSTPDGQITLSDMHVEWCDQAKRWIAPNREPRQNRTTEVGPRNSGKSTWWFLIMPTWAGAHQHRKFAAAFSDSATQAETHLLTFRHELETNALLRLDFPELCRPARKLRGTAESDNVGMYIAANRFVFAARGVDTKSLGLKVGDQRPDLLILDDIEPGEENYSPALKEKRLGALIDSILPLNEFAAVVLVGTVTMPDSIVHDLVRTVTQPGDPAQWITDQRFVCHYYPALDTDETTGELRSIWPEKWPVAYLKSIRHTRDFKKNFQNDPTGRDGDYFTADDITYGSLPAVNAMLLSIDPAVTSKAKSDFTACAVIGCQPAQYGIEGGRRTVSQPKRCEVRYAVARRVQVGEPLRAWVLAVLADHPDTRGVLIETNQGGDAWKAILHDLPVPIRTVHNTVPKEVRAATLATRYQTPVNCRRVIHTEAHPQLEAQLVGFPKSAYDDLVDAVGNGVAVFLGGQEKPEAPTGVRSASYA